MNCGLSRSRVCFCILVCLFLICLLQNAYSQDNPDLIIENILEGKYDGEEEMINIDDYDIDLISNKLKINIISDDDILKMPYLNFFQKRNIISYRNEWGAIYSPTELLMIDGFDTAMVSRLSAIIDYSIKVADKKIQLKDILFNAKHDLLFKISANNDSSIEYESESIGYVGDRNKLLFKYKYSISDKLFAACVVEKDAGEKLLISKNCPEHISGFVQWKGKNINAVLGDYYIQFGQGMSMWAGHYFGGGIESISQLRFPQKIKPDTGSDEISYLEGAAVQLKLHSFGLTSYFSYRANDATVKYDEISGSHYFTSLKQSGYHRTASEISSCDNIHEIMTGINVELILNRLILSADANYLKYDIPYIPSNSIENINRFYGIDNYSYSINYLIVWKKSYGFGEVSLSKGNGMGIISGIYFQPNTFINGSITYKYVTPDYHGVENSSFTSSYGINGIELKIITFPYKRITLYSTVDISKNQWFSVNKSVLYPSTSAGIRVKYEINRLCNLYIHYIYNAGYKKNSFENEHIAGSTFSLRNKVRLHFECKPFDYLTLRSRLEYLFTDNERGCLLYNDIAFRFSSGLLLISRVTCYDTDSYDSRLYSYENDVLYGFSIPAYYGYGYSFFILCKYNFLRHYTFWIKIGYERSYDRDKNSLTVTSQIRVKF